MFDVAKVGILFCTFSIFSSLLDKTLGFFYQQWGFHDEPYHFVITVS